MDINQSSAVQVGNFDMGECFCEVKCIHGHETRLFNLGRAHFVACDTCRTYIRVGSNLMSGWRQENRDVWQRNAQSVRGYRMLEW
jgi:hypothetical protein